MKIKNKFGQEEMIGFALIMIIVAVILLVFLGFSLREEQKETVESYEVESFIQSFLQYTTDCRDNIEYLAIQDLIFDCDEGKKCLDERDTCQVLNSKLEEIAEESWKVEGGSPVKGYLLKVKREDSDMISIEKGNQTSNYKSARQDFSKAGGSFGILFTAFY